MKLFQLYFLALSLVFSIGCQPDLCEDVACGPGNCVEGICDCPDGFIGDNCEIALCFGVPCINGDCNLQTETCECYPNFYGEECNKLCVNGEFINGFCHCEVGYEGFTCQTESRDHFLGWWSCEEWSWASQIGGSPVAGALPGSIKFECGISTPEIKMFPTENSSGLMLLNSSNRIAGQVSQKTINFDLQYLTTEVTVHGSASLDINRILNIELFVFNPATSLTEEAKGTFTFFRHIDDCD